MDTKLPCSAHALPKSLNKSGTGLRKGDCDIAALPILEIASPDPFQTQSGRLSPRNEMRGARRIIARQNVSSLFPSEPTTMTSAAAAATINYI